MSKYISQYDEVVSSDSTDYYLLQRGTAYKKFTKANFFNQIANELGIGQSTLVGLTDVDTTYLSNGDTISYNSATETFEFVALGGSVALDDITDVTITGLATNDVLAWNGSAYVNNATYARVSGVTTGFIPVSTGSNTFTNGTLTDNGTNIGFNTATYTYSFSFGGNTARTFGVNRHTTADTAGVSFSLYAGGATSGATNKNGGNYDIYAGISTGTGTSQFNVYTSPAGSTGTTDNTQTLKLNIDGAGTAYFTTSTANSKFKTGHNLATILTQTTGMGIMLSRPSDGSYTVHGGMFASATSDMLTITGFGAGIRFVRNPSTDTAPMVTIGATATSYICAGVTTATFPVHFEKVAGSGGGRLSYWGMTGNLTGIGGLIAHEYSNAVTNNTYNTCFLINVSGSSTSNRAVHAETGDIWVQAGQMAIGATAPTATSKLSIIGLAANSQTVAIANELVTTGSNQLITINSSNVTSATKFGTYYTVTGSSTSGGNKAIYIYSGNFILREAGGSMGLGIDTPASVALLDVTSTTKGVVFPRMTATQASAITAIEGLMLFATDTNGTFTSVGYWQYKGGAWAAM